jgi:hypothetical protein
MYQVSLSSRRRIVATLEGKVDEPRWQDEQLEWIEHKFIVGVVVVVVCSGL